jgi:hypothetical protein
MADHRDDDTPDGASPSPGVLAAFRAQATPELFKAAERCARKWANLPRRAGRRIDNLYIRELVNDAIQDTWTGALQWDPERQTLIQHIRDVIRGRAWNDARQARRFPHVAWNAAANDESSDRIEIDVLAACESDELALSGLTQLLETLVTALREHVADNDAALAILDCWAEGIVECDEVMARTGLSRNKFKAGRRRLLSSAQLLSGELHGAVRDFLRRAS